ncbi:spermatogenesis-associated protein 31D1-like protein [Corchorus olitorius]|uniref:Spermatogenesis-associated protein 31D1-like protein n=1 Tax=Corchorus olitorius TaxID=93759 RepID=A0A1R3HZV3_9ROSI|nr:spermatogenesis-associated protein 31D1-like protein [Corchorus olitorius]
MAMGHRPPPPPPARRNQEREEGERKRTWKEGNPTRQESKMETGEAGIISIIIGKPSRHPHV